MAGYTGSYISDTDVDNWASGATDAEKEAAIRMAEEKLDLALGTNYKSTAFDLRLNGNRANRLTLPLTAKIRTITEIRVNGVVLDSSWYAFDSASIYLDLTSSGAGATPELLMMMSESAEGWLFPKGLGNIRIRGTSGMTAEIPETIKQAALILVRFGNDPSLYTEYKVGSESIGSYSYSTGTGAEKLAWTGIKEADDIIKLFRRRRPIIMAT